MEASIASAWVNFARREGHEQRFSPFRIRQPIVRASPARTRVTVIPSLVRPRLASSPSSHIHFSGIYNHVFPWPVRSTLGLSQPGKGRDGNARVRPSLLPVYVLF